MDNSSSSPERVGPAASGFQPLLKALLAALALLVLALAIWFLGPYVALGDMHPMADMGVRVVLMVVLLAALLAWLLDWSARATWSVLGAVALSLLLWHGGPLLALGPVRPLAEVWQRLLAIAALWLVLLAWGLYRLYRALQADEKLVQKWLHREGAQPALAKDEVRALAATARQRVAQLRRMHLTVAGRTGSVLRALRRLTEGKRYLYELPWYMLIGQPAAGKSSIVLGSGLKFALGEQMESAWLRMSPGRAQGTGNCDWWLTNEAVLLDTAGRYTDAGDSDRADDHSRRVNEAEWRGFLGVLRQLRPRAPINGAVVVVDTARLATDAQPQRLALAGQLRARLEELRLHLGVRFPVYLVLSKADVLPGFEPYFASLTSEGRSQVWGCTLPWENEALPRGRHESSGGSKEVDANRHTELTAAFASLVQRVRDGLPTRLQEEFETDRRQALYVFPDELAALQQPLLELVEAVFAPSRFDTTQSRPMLRGVYLSSAMQSGEAVSAQRLSLSSRLRHAAGAPSDKLGSARPTPGSTARKGYFLMDLWQRLIFTESHLVKPNLKWEARVRLLRWIGHAGVLLTFSWVSAALALSYRNNHDYLQEVSHKTDALTEQMKHWLSDPTPQQSEHVLGQAQSLPLQAGLDLAAPALPYRYGLYSADAVAQAAHAGYGELLDRLVLPVVVGHMEQVMRRSLRASDAELAYRTLHAYLLLHDATRYSQSPDNARDVRDWVTAQWQATSDAETGLAQKLGNSAAMVGHLEWMFSGQRLTQSAQTRNEGLVEEVRSFLGKRVSSERLYERMLAGLRAQSPPDFSLVRALGPQAGTLFSRASGKSLEKGVPGLFTYDGYHEVFEKRLPQRLTLAEQDDLWVMGGTTPTSAEKTRDASGDERKELMQALRRQYLEEYALHWEEFLSDIRLVQSDKSGTLAFDLGLLRQLAAADSPLIRLSRMAARETTLSRPLQSETSGDKSLFDKAGEQFAEQARKATGSLGMRAEQRLERQSVDDKFAALREVVTGQPEGGTAAIASKAGLDTMINALNEYYTVLVVADTALNAGTLPPAGADAATKLRIEAGKLPAPMREVLMDVSQSGTDKVTQGAAGILRGQAQAQMDRLVGLMALTVSEPCQHFIAGRYPFADSAQEVAADDFNAFFADGGAADEYFRKYLGPLVDTSVRPWRYKAPSTGNMLSGTEGLPQGQMPQPAITGPTLTGELLKLLAQSGPNPEAFAQIAQVREMFFREPGAKRLSWKGSYTVASLDPSVTEWVIDIDGQVQRYAHGPVQPTAIQWPAARGGTIAELQAHPRVKPDTSSITARGPWAWLHLVERGTVSPGTQPGRSMVEFQFDNRRAVLEVTSGGPSPFNSRLLRNFTCPGRVG